MDERLEQHIGLVNKLCEQGQHELASEMIYQWHEAHCAVCGEPLASQEIGGYMGTLYDCWFCCDAHRIIWLMDNGFNPSQKLQILCDDKVVYESE